MYLKAENDIVIKFPYSIGRLRKDNPNTSFPRNMTQSQFAEHNVYKVTEIAKPEFDTATQHLQRQEPVGSNNNWSVGWDIIETFSDYTDEEGVVHTKTEQDEASVLALESELAAKVRSERDVKLAPSDWMGLSDNTMTPEWAAYRQALRDVPAQEGFPHTVVWPDEI